MARDAAGGARRLALIDEAGAQQDLYLSAFDIEHSDRATLTWPISRASKRRRSPGIDKLVGALSAELFRLRTGERG